MHTWTITFRGIDRDRFDEIRSGEKTVETRAATPKYQLMNKGDTLVFVCGDDTFAAEISKVYRWGSVEEMVQEVPLTKIMPNVDSVSEMKKVYSSYPDYNEKITQYGLIGFELAWINGTYSIHSGKK